VAPDGTALRQALSDLALRPIPVPFFPFGVWKGMTSGGTVWSAEQVM
jgi:hypothetical protein